MDKKLINLYVLSYYDKIIKNFIDTKVQELNIPTRVSELENDSNFITSDPSIPDTPVDPEEPETPVEPEIPVDPSSNAGIVYSSGTMIVKDKDLANGQYIFRYIDSNDNIIDNFNPIMTFDVDHSDENTDLPSSGIVDEN